VANVLDSVKIQAILVLPLILPDSVLEVRTYSVAKWLRLAVLVNAKTILYLVRITLPVFAQVNPIFSVAMALVQLLHFHLHREMDRVLLLLIHSGTARFHHAVLKSVLVVVNPTTSVQSSFPEVWLQLA